MKQGGPFWVPYNGTYKFAFAIVYSVSLSESNYMVQIKQKIEEIPLEF